MSPTSASIATLGLLIIINSLIIGAQGFTRGSQAMYGIPKLVNLPIAIGLAAVAIIVARLYREFRRRQFNCERGAITTRRRGPAASMCLPRGCAPGL